MHLGAVGMSRSGKTSLALAFARGLAGRGRRIAVLDKMRDPRWPADFLTTDPAEFLAFANSNLRCWLFADEWGATVGRLSGAAVYDALGTSARHYGHSLFVIAHRWAQLTPTLRDQIDPVFCFRQGARSAKLLAEEFVQEGLITTIPVLPRGRFVEVGRFADVRPGTIDYRTLRLKYDAAGGKRRSKAA